MRGYSIYFPEIDYQYIQKMGACGWQLIFTSLHIKEYQVSFEQLKAMFAHPLLKDKQIVVDVSPATLAILDIADYTVLSELGITHLRLDYGFSMSDMLRLQEQFVLIFNASVLDEATLIAYQEAGIRLSSSAVMHNFYPHEYTGLSASYVLEKNTLFRKYGLRTQGFIAGDASLRGPVFAGLPTIEQLRWCNPASAFVIMQEQLGFDDVYVGDFQISSQQREAIDRYCATGAITLTCSEITAGCQQYLERLLTNRRDVSEYVVRICESRAESGGGQQEIAPQNTVARLAGSITVDNNEYGRYCGEMQILRCDLPPDPRVNVVGQVDAADLAVLSCIKSATPVYLVKKAL